MSGAFTKHGVKAKAQESCNKRKQYNSKRHNASIRQESNYGLNTKLFRQAALLNHIGIKDTGFKGPYPKKIALCRKRKYHCPFPTRLLVATAIKGRILRPRQPTRKHDTSWPMKQAPSFPKK
jgi:hypothetical protein